jgi:hypothetical protein
MSQLTAQAQRLREFDYRTVPAGSWIFLGLAIVDVFARVTTPSRGVALTDLPSLLIVAGPLLLAAAVLYANPADRRIVWGSIVFAAAEILIVVATLAAPERIGQNALSDLSTLLFRLSYPLVPIALLIIGIGLGGLRSGYALTAGAIGLVIYAISESRYLGQLPQLLAAGMPMDAAVTGIIGPLATVGWAFIAGAAFDRGFRLMAAGAGLIVLAAALTTVLTVLNLTNPTTDFGLLSAVFQLVNVVAWACLIVGVLLELRPRPAQRQRRYRR